MMRKIYFAFTLLGSILLTSCDNYLDIQPVGKVIPNTLAEYRALLTTVYNTRLNDKAVTELRTDIVQVSKTHTEISKSGMTSLQKPEQEISYGTNIILIFITLMP